MTKYLPYIINIITLLFILAFVIYAQWTEPIQSPPLDNIPPPINVGTTAQLKAGALGVKGFFLSQRNMIGRQVITNNSGVDISSQYTESAYNWQSGESYSLSLSSLNFLYSLPGNNCETSSGPIQTAGIYEGKVRTTPSQFSFRCNDMAFRPIETYLLRDRGLKFSSSGSCNSGVCSGDNRFTLRSFWTEFPGDLSETLYMPSGSNSCTVKISVCSVEGSISEFSIWGGAALPKLTLLSPNHTLSQLNWAEKLFMPFQTPCPIMGNMEKKFATFGVLGVVIILMNLVTNF